MRESFNSIAANILVFVIVMIVILLLSVLIIFVGYIVSLIFPISLFQSSLLSVIITSAIGLSLAITKAEARKEDELVEILSEMRADWDSQMLARKRKMEKKRAVITTFRPDD